MSTDRVTRLSESLSLREGLLFCEEVCIKNLQQDLLKQYGDQGGSPFFLYSKLQLQENIESYTRALSTSRPSIRAHLGYALKANYNLHLVRIVQGFGCFAIAVSGNELQLALTAGFPAERIILNGNGKYKWELELAARSGCLVNVDSLFDFSHIRDAAKSTGQKIKCLIRLNPDIDPQVHPFLATGLSKSKFGVDDSLLNQLLDSLVQESCVELVGLHCYLGSTISTTQVFQECLEVMISIVESVRGRGVTTLQYINLGGGLNIDYKKHQGRTADDQGIDRSAAKSPPTPSDLIACIDGKKLNELGLTLILEPGRSIVGSAGTLVSKVIGCKRSGSKNYIIVDGSMTEVIRPSLYGAYHHIELTEPAQSHHLEGSISSTLSQTSGTPSQTSSAPNHTSPTSADTPQRVPAGSTRELFDVVGPVCECADFLGKDRLMARPHEGCGVAVLDVGAYCASMSSNYNMRIRPAEILVQRSEWKIIKRPETLDDLMRPYIDNNNMD